MSKRIRAPLTEELRLIARVAYLYHMQHQKQSDIAAQLDISQATVSRALKRAEKEDIVRITVNMPTGVYTQLESELCARYGLKAAIVVHCEDESDEAIFDHIGGAAAYYVETTLGANEVVGLSSWSSSLLAMVNAMHPLAKATNAKVVQILGGVGNPSAKIYASRITEQFAALVQGEAIYLPAPGVASSIQMHEELMENPFVSQAVEFFNRITLGLLGIGCVEPSRLLMSSGNVFTADELAMLHERGAVGDICLRFYDVNGEPVLTPLSDRVISVQLEQLKRARRSVGIAGGARKINAIRGAINGRWINVLITDHMTALRLMK
ncbi:sugar-binding transcriptional regulator [Sorangium sp. So ce1389]|uniref:sugar-binding transcriptional regulator n=1 Tax=Sorangium sp. So ce1389 TaxID=3133336 RepID=UPI003F60FBA1